MSLNRITSKREAIALAKRALAEGGTIEHSQIVRWDVAGTCDLPLAVDVTGRKLRGDPARGSNGSTLVNLMVPCRKCTNCLQYRSYLWRTRAENEIIYAPRTWFGTLTLRPSEQYRAMLEGQRAKRGSPSSAGEFASRCHAASKWVTRYLKRVRAQNETRFRYLLVAESHKSGLPHFHMLLHEQHGKPQVRHRSLSEQWVHGFSNWKLIDGADRAPAAYVAKYLSKSARARVRASQRYGAPASIAVLNDSRRREKLTPTETTSPSGLNEKRPDARQLSSVLSPGLSKGEPAAPDPSGENAARTCGAVPA